MKSIFLFAFLAVSLPALCEENWNLVTDDDVKVFVKSSEDARVSELRAETEFDCTPSEVRSVLVDDEYTKKTPYVAEARVVEQVNPKTRVKYTRLAFPIINDRDYFIQVTRESDLDSKGQGIYVSRWHSWDKPQPIPEATVRVTTVRGYWRVEKSENTGRTKVVYYLFFDPGGNIPGWVVNMGNKRVMPDVLRNLYKEILRRRSVAHAT